MPGQRPLLHRVRRVGGVGAQHERLLVEADEHRLVARRVARRRMQHDASVAEHVVGAPQLPPGDVVLEVGRHVDRALVDARPVGEPQLDLLHEEPRLRKELDPAAVVVVQVRQRDDFDVVGLHADPGQLRDDVVLGRDPHVEVVGRGAEPRARVVGQVGMRAQVEQHQALVVLDEEHVERHRERLAHLRVERVDQRPRRDLATGVERVQLHSVLSWLVVPRLHPGRDRDPVPGVDRRDGPDQAGQLLFREQAAAAANTSSGTPPVGQPRHRLGQRERRPLARRVPVRLAPRRRARAGAAPSSPSARASFVCMSTQNAQPLICEARVLTSSTRSGSSPNPCASRSRAGTWSRTLRGAVPPGRAGLPSRTPTRRRR